MELKFLERIFSDWKVSLKVELNRMQLVLDDFHYWILKDSTHSVGAVTLGIIESDLNLVLSESCTILLSFSYVFH